MKLNIVLPYKIFTQRDDIISITAETDSGSFGLLPHRLDCVAALTPGIFIYKDAAGEENWVAVDIGIFVKCEMIVTISVRNAFTDPDPKRLQSIIKNEFLEINEYDKKVRSIMTKLESSFLQSMMNLKNE
jgi:F-type H+-transporting ATPase subunit epsilon